MEVVKNIFFNTDKLIQNSKIKISYIGNLYNKNVNKVYIHYGFNNNWEKVKEEEMIKSELGYQIEIELGSNDIFNFCIKDDLGNWDNNDGKNYNFEIEKPEMSLIEVDNKSLISVRHLRRSYILSKKIRIAVYKMLIMIPKIISGNYKRKAN